MDFNPEKIKLIIGLGNPDKEYENTYHNAGFLFIDWIKENQQVSSIKYQVLSILKSDECMNNSGEFVAKAMKKLGAKPEEILIAHDDSDLELGKYKIGFGRGAAGHHGVESIQQHLKTNDFWRLRIGIRPVSPIGPIGLIQPKRQKADLPTEAPRAKAGEFVLKKISAADMATLKGVFEKIAEKLT